MNEPVAWMRESDKEVCSIKGKQGLLDEEGTDWNFKIPLYTYPAKTLTELEFENIVDACDLSGDWDTQYDFSKMFRLVNEAILKKASEK
jgi:hypothetical protein